MTGIEAMLWYLLWMIALLLINVGHRIPLALLGKKSVSIWTRGQANDDPALIVRAGHAHANCVENFILFSAVVLAAVALGRSNVVDSVAAYILYARVAQSTVHLIGTSFPLVLARATFFLIQLVLVAYIAWQLLHPAVA